MWTHSHRIHAWYIYLRLADLYGKCWQIYYTCLVPCTAHGELARLSRGLATLQVHRAWARKPNVFMFLFSCSSFFLINSGPFWPATLLKVVFPGCRMSSPIATRQIFAFELCINSPLTIGGGFKCFVFSPVPGEMIQFWLAHIFQMGWFNHQLAYDSNYPFCFL